MICSSVNRLRFISVSPSGSRTLLVAGGIFRCARCRRRGTSLSEHYFQAFRVEIISGVRLSPNLGGAS